MCGRNSFARRWSGLRLRTGVRPRPTPPRSCVRDILCGRLSGRLSKPWTGVRIRSGRLGPGVLATVSPAVKADFPPGPGLGGGGAPPNFQILQAKGLILSIVRMRLSTSVPLRGPEVPRVLSGLGVISSSSCILSASATASRAISVSVSPPVSPPSPSSAIRSAPGDGNPLFGLDGTVAKLWPVLGSTAGLQQVCHLTPSPDLEYPPPDAPGPPALPKPPA